MDHQQQICCASSPILLHFSLACWTCAGPVEKRLHLVVYCVLVIDTLSCPCFWVTQFVAGFASCHLDSCDATQFLYNSPIRRKLKFKRENVCLPFLLLVIIYSVWTRRRVSRICVTALDVTPLRSFFWLARPLARSSQSSI
jgi:hypothetical protein